MWGIESWEGETNDHACAPEDSDSRQEDARPNFTNYNCGGRLEENIRDEEDECNKIISAADEVKSLCHSV